MRLAPLLLALVVFSAPALAEDAATSVVILRGSSAPPTPWYEPPPEPTVIVQPVYVPVYYPMPGYGGFIHRHGHAPSARRSR
ncbi:hypothetical protein SAMN02990966_04424 [Rhodospirillales bacterium URHD0017]|nr:hypothetical protein SAMN02990966_04424 [Rhodospirillales bacterium URHD0017]